MADKVYKVKLDIQTGKADKAVSGLNKKVATTGKTAAASGAAGASGFAAFRSSILSTIPALNSLKVALISTGVGALVVAIGSLIAFMTSAAGKAKEFQSAVASLGAISGSTAEEMEVLTNMAKDLGATTIFTASQVVQLQTELAKLGFTAGEIQNSTPSILNLAAALDVGLAEAAEFAGATVRGFGLDTKDTAMVVDIMAKSAVTSAQNFGTLVESFKLAAPTARAVGVSVQETAALLGVLANANLKGSIAGTGLSKTFMQLSKKGMTLQEAMDKVQGSSNKLNTAVDLVGIVGAKTLLTLTENQDQLGDLQVAMDNASESADGFSGAAEQIASQRFDTLEGDMRGLSSAWEGFLLSVEDGEGPINKLQRLFVQGLTVVVRGFTNAVDYLGFLFPDIWNEIVLTFEGTKDILAGGFQFLGNTIEKFSLKAILALSKVPLLGDAIDSEKVKARLEETEQALLDSASRMEEGFEQLEQANSLVRTRNARYQIQKEETEKRRIKIEEAKKTDEALRELEEDNQEAEEEARKQREKDLEKVLELEKKFIKKQQDLEDQTRLEKAERQRERALEELDQLKLNEVEKREALLAINDYYDQLEEEAAILDKEDQDAKDLQLFEDQQKKLDNLAKAEENLQKVIRDQRNKTFDDAVKLAGEESKLGKAILIAKQLMAFKEEILGRKKTIASAKEQLKKAKTDVAGAGTAQAQGIPETAKIGFPQNIPMLIAYAAQAVGFVSAIKSAFGKTKKAVADVGAPTGADPQLATASIPTPVAPVTDTVSPALSIGGGGLNAIAQALGEQATEPIQAYVVADDVTTAQGLERNIIEQTSIG